MRTPAPFFLSVSPPFPFPPPGKKTTNSLTLLSTCRSVSQAVLGRSQLNAHATRRTPIGATRLMPVSFCLVGDDIVGRRGLMVLRLRPCMTGVHLTPLPPPLSLPLCLFSRSPLPSHRTPPPPIVHPQRTPVGGSAPHAIDCGTFQYY